MRAPSLPRLSAPSWIALGLCLTAGAGCGPASRRDLGAIPQRQITYDDMCHLQDYFDQRSAAHALPFRSENEQSTETSRVEPDERGQPRRVILGEGTYVITDHSDRTRLNRLLHDEYHRLPTPLHLGRPDTEVHVHVGWWQSGTIRRLRPDMDIDLTANGETHTLPFNPCVGEYLFGDTAYAMRRNVIDAESARAHGEIPRQYLPDAGGTETAPMAADAAVNPPDGTVGDALGDALADTLADTLADGTGDTLDALGDVPGDIRGNAHAGAPTGHAVRDASVSAVTTRDAGRRRNP